MARWALGGGMPLKHVVWRAGIPQVAVSPGCAVLLPGGEAAVEARMDRHAEAADDGGLITELG